ncbi:MAG: transposase, partial [Thermoplasmata archaeon]
QIAHFLPSNTWYKRKHIQRFLSSFNERIFHVMFSVAWKVVGKPEHIVISIDWTKIQNRYLFLASISAQSRTLPIAVILTDRKTVLDRLRLIDILSRIIPAHLYTIIIADGEFSSPTFMAYISKHGFHYAMRRRSTLFNGTPLKNYSLTSEIEDLWFGNYTSSGLRTRVIINKHKDEVYYLVSDLEYGSGVIVEIYKQRFWIEETFRDFKSGMGFGKYSDEQNIERLFGLLCVYSLSYMVMYKEEKHVFKEPEISFYTHFKMTMKDRIIQVVFLSELIALRKASRRKVN